MNDENILEVEVWWPIGGVITHLGKVKNEMNEYFNDDNPNNITNTLSPICYHQYIITKPLSPIRYHQWIADWFQYRFLGKQFGTWSCLTILKWLVKLACLCRLCTTVTDSSIFTHTQCTCEKNVVSATDREMHWSELMKDEDTVLGFTL